MPREIEAKSILNKTKRRDPWYLDDYSLNMYQACSFNCLYCYIRGSKYGQNMEQRLAAKINGPALLQKQLANRAKKHQYGFIVLSSATDPYLQLEKKYELTRQALEIILAHRFPVHMITKSDLILRDLDLLEAIHQQAILPDNLANQLTGGTLISFSFSSLDDKLNKIFEPGATPPSRRLQTVQKCLDAGFHTGISLMPLIPYITDTGAYLQRFFQTFQNMGVKYVLPATLSLFGAGPSDSKNLMFKAISKHYPELVEKYQRFFQTDNRMPEYYRQAFQKKMLELSLQYGLPNRIVSNP